MMFYACIDSDTLWFLQFFIYYVLIAIVKLLGQQ